MLDAMIISAISCQMSNACHSIHAHHRNTEHQTFIVHKQDNNHFAQQPKA